MPASKWVSDQNALAAIEDDGNTHFAGAAFTAMAEDTIGLDAWGGIQCLLAGQDVEYGTMLPIMPAALKAKKELDPDAPGLLEALASPESQQWSKAMDQEVCSLEKRKTWDVIQLDELPKGAKVVPGT